MAFTLPDLPYAHDALEPHIDERTMRIHHGKHHQGYTDNLNEALEGRSELAGRSIEEILRRVDELPDEIRTAVRNNGGGFANHGLFWTILSPEGGGTLSGELREAIDERFGSFDEFRTEFANVAKGRFGSGWAWLVVDDDGELDLYSTPNQDSPLMEGDTPILGLDVWEHAYYLNYQNRRADYIDAFWNVVSWEQVARNLTAARRGAETPATTG